MRTRLGQPATVSCWVLLLVTVAAHAALAVLAAAEFATLGWPLPTWFDTGAVTLVLVSAVARPVLTRIRGRIKPWVTAKASSPATTSSLAAQPSTAASL